MKERLDKFLANAGIGTRSEVKKMIRYGRIRVNDVPATCPEQKIDPENDRIFSDGSELSGEKWEYYLLYKPSGCVTATRDNREKTVMDYISSRKKDRLFPVGRLDKDTEGLLLITDDGGLAHGLLSPARHVPKTYYAVVTGLVEETLVQQFADGIEIGDDKPTLPAKLRVLEKDGLEGEAKSKVLVTIREGRYHQIKRMFQKGGHQVVYLKRISMGNLRLDPAMKPGDSRRLTPEEIRDLRLLNSANHDKLDA